VAAKRGDVETLGLCVRYFNNFLREAIKRKDTHAIYDVFHQYRLLARDLPGQADLLRSIGRYFRFYGDLAGASGLGFVPQLAAFDLGFMTRRTYEAASPAARVLLEETLAIPHAENAAIVKAKVILGGFFLEKGLAAEAARVRENLRDVTKEAARSAAKDLLEAERVYFEVTARQMNLEYLPPERRAHVEAFAASLGGMAS
jgi:hypothetical protein